MKSCGAVGEKTLGLVLLLFVLSHQQAWAGMTSYMLSDIAKVRLEVISFFFLLMLIMAAVFRLCWNALARDFTKLPRMTYKTACASMLVGSVFTGLILTMISGARELMTPGAWERIGVGYQLSRPEDKPELWLDAARQRAIEQLRDALWSAAHAGEGRIASVREETGVPLSLWRSPDPKGSLYILRSNGKGHTPEGTFGFIHNDGQSMDAKPKLKGDVADYILVHEPDTFGMQRFVITSTGSVKKMHVNKLYEQMEQQARNVKAKAER